MKRTLKQEMQILPILIERKDDKESFVYLGQGLYRTIWGLKNGSIQEIPFESFDENNFNFYYR